MATIDLVTADRVRVVGFPVEQLTLVAGEAITAGMPVRIDTAGKFTAANGSSAGEARIWGIATQTVAAGLPVTAVRRGYMDGWDLSAMAFDADVFLSNTDGRLDTAAGTVNVVVGTVIAATGVTLGTAFDKILHVKL
jgi:hypothetical protein